MKLHVYTKDAPTKIGQHRIGKRTEDNGSKNTNQNPLYNILRVPKKCNQRSGCCNKNVKKLKTIK